ncbi:L-rhamnose mutarotase [Mucilaginibacter aquatilis]|uniref:L-rhamnose mutarotase n=1 Tax=Mucilaginibacter aquatilis TaxID=1517760 RepID=A0A6I4I9C6_9SPHI|nr:L-rhamnose mutarotase [Mucilaginibacter aquatilis]MVN90056.1 L-rhamnose mutarotase [Mucilaginibacter aquatilis]
MNKALRKTLLLLLTITLSAGVRAADIYVSPKGNDANDGTKGSPKATLNAALRQARELRRLNDESVKNGIRIIMAGGEYRLNEPVFIRPEDSGTATSPTWIEAAANGQPVLSGGINIKGWRKAVAKVAGLPASAQGKVWMADVPSLDGQALLFRQLWVNGKKAVRAREVDNDNLMSRILSVDKVKQEMWIPAPKIKTGAIGQMEMLIHQMWAIANLRIKTLTVVGDKAKVTFQQPESRIQFEHPWPQAVIDKDKKMNGNSAFYLTNALEFLNQPGEWYADAKTNKIYYWPRTGETITSAKVVAPAQQTLLKMTGTADRPVSYVYVKGIAFEHATWLRPSQQGHVPHQAGMYMTDAYKLKVAGTPEKKGLENQAWVGRPAAAVEVAYAHHTGFEGCRFEHMASTGVNYQRGTHDNEIKGNLFKDIGGTGIQVGTFSDEAFEVHLPYNPDDKREVCTNERIINNLITDVTNEDWGCVGIGTGYVKNISIEHNDISEVSYSGISMGWGWTKLNNAMSGNKITANKISRYGKHLYDVSGIYTLSAQPGSVISENYIDSVYKVPYAHDVHHWFYLYCDEGSSGFTVKNNWTPADKFLQNANGPDNKWENNGPQVSNSIKQNAGLQNDYKHLFKNVSTTATSPINYVGYDAFADNPQVIEIVNADDKAVDLEQVKDLCIRNGIPKSAVYQWTNRTVIFGYIPNAESQVKKLKEMFPKAEVKLYTDRFYTFNRKNNCPDGKTVAEWDNVILSTNLVADTKKQQEYLNYHATQFTKWPEVSKGFCNASFQQLVILKNGRQLMLIISIPKGEDLDKLNPKTTENNPRVNDWNKIMSQYQEGVKGTKPGEVWVFFQPTGK